MNPVHFQFVTTSPSISQYTIERLFEILDDVELDRRDLILKSAYLCFTSVNRDGYEPETAKEDRYRDFKAAFIENALQHAAEDDLRWRGAYAVFGLISYLLIESLRDKERGVYEAFRSNNQEQLKQFDDAMQGDDTARQRAMEWSIKAIKRLEAGYVAKFRRWSAYRCLCEEVVAPLLTTAE